MDALCVTQSQETQAAMSCPVVFEGRSSTHTSTLCCARRRLTYMPIFGVGMPTVEGIIGALK